jgi:hypothetical protein
MNLATGFQLRRTIQQRPQLISVAEQQKIHMGKSRTSNLHPLNYHLGRLVAAHGIKRYRYAPGQCSHPGKPKVRAMLGGGSGFGNHFATIIVAARGTHMVRKLRLAAIRALHMANGLQSMVRPAHVATGFGGLFLRNSHFN